MAAERISRRLIRLFPPDSVFAKNLPELHQECPDLLDSLMTIDEGPLKLGSPELPGLRFVWPTIAARRVALEMAIAARTALSDYPWE